MQKKDFKRLGTKRGALVLTILYSAEDHLLIEKKIGYTAQYERIFYDDIISIITYKDPSWKNKLTILTTLSIFLLVIILTILTTTSNLPFLISILVLFLPLWVFLIREILLGPTAKTQVRTATSIKEIDLSSRYRKSKWVLDRVQKLIEEAQGAIDLSGLDDNTMEYNAPPLFLKSKDTDKDKGNNIPTSKYNKLYSFFLFALFLEVIITSIQLKLHGRIYLFLSAVSAMIIILNAIVLAKQKGLYIRKPLMIVSWISMIIFISFTVVGVFLGVFIGLNNDFLIPYETIKLIHSDINYFNFVMIYLIMLGIVSISGLLISLKGHHSIYSKP